MNTVTTTTVSLGSVTAGLGVWAWFLARWWKGGSGKGGPSGGRDPKALLPLVSSTALGMLAITAAGGLLGTVAVMILHTTNTLGNWSLTAATGTVTPSVTRSGRKALSPGGSAALALYCVIIVALWKSGTKLYQGKVISGVISGVLLGLSAGFSGIASAGVVTLFNAAGDKLTGLL